MDRREHWDAVFARRRPDRVSWYQVRPALSLDLIELAGAGHALLPEQPDAVAHAVIDYLRAFPD